ncbi:MAG TPA: host attachment protein [Tepidisphaeraceae bacterium]|jgi:protein required for attachment to host cells|nr:host attachment protein [Tepidisphaeraceae bacterium]
MTHWILIADASGARIFSSTPLGAQVQLLRELPNPEGRKRNQELVTDEPGRLFSSGSPGTRSGTERKVTAHDEAADRFAHTLADLLYKELEHKAYDTLSIVAPPHFLGTLRPLLVKEVSRHLSKTETKDVADMPIHELRSYLQTLLG